MIFQLRFVISDPKNPRIPNFIPIGHFWNFGPPFWIRHFLLLNIEFGSVISDPKNPRIQNFIPIRHFLNFGPPFWIRHFLLLNVEFGFSISDPKNNQVPTFKCTELKENCMLQSVIIVNEWPILGPQYRGRHFEFWNFYFRFGLSELKYPYIWNFLPLLTHDTSTPDSYIHGLRSPRNFVDSYL